MLYCTGSIIANNVQNWHNSSTSVKEKEIGVKRRTVYDCVILFTKGNLV